MARRVLLVLAALLALARPAAAQLAPGDPFVPEGQVRVNDYWFRQNAAIHHGEWVWGEESLSTWADAPGLQMPLVLYRDAQSLNVQAGAQRSLLRDALLDPISFRGVRLERDLGPVRLSVSGGQTMDPNILTFTRDYRHFGLALGAPLGRRGSAGLFASTWSPVGAGATHTLVSALVDPDLRGPFRVSGAWGVDFGRPDLPLADRRAFRWDVAWLGPRLSLAGRQEAHGRAYGPVNQENFRQGNDTFTLDGRYRILPELEFSQNWQRYRYESPAGGPLLTSRQENLQSQLTWLPGPAVRVTARHRSLLAGVGSAPDQRQYADNLDVWWSPRSELYLNLGYEGLHGELGPRSGQVSAGLTYSVTPEDRLGLTWSRNNFDLGPGIEAVEQSGVSYQRTFGDLGRMRAEYRVSSGRGFDSSTASLGMDVRPDPRWRLSAAANVSEGGGVQNTALDFGVGWLLDEHSELALEFQSNPILAQGFVGSGTTVPAQWVTLTIHQSFGGGLEADYQRRLRPRITVRARYRAAGTDDWQPLEGARVVVDGETRTLAGDGEARLDLAAGDYLVRLETERLGPNYEVQGGDRRPLRLDAAARENVDFDVTAWSSVRAVVFQDLDGTGAPPVGYVPLADVPVRSGEAVETTGPDGVARFRRLDAATARVELPAGALPPGVLPTTPASVEVALTPGRETVVLFGVRGMGRLRGAVRLVPRGEAEPGPGPAGVHLTLNGRRLGTSGPDGVLDVEAPSGRLRLDVDTSETGLDAYLVTPLEPVDLAPEGVAEIAPLLALRGTLTVQLVRKGEPLPLAGVPITRADGSFLYTDKNGKVEFRRLPMGPQEVLLSPRYLPAGHRLVGPERRRVELRSGDRQVVEFELR